ncbi:hypothetical protein BURPS406E_D0383 [Burkholderia pseudomallei 406e]|nr:hypothetical protein BURPS406E_D0383 [Burkholderia pseudomallei 406e]
MMTGANRRGERAACASGAMGVSRRDMQHGPYSPRPFARWRFVASGARMRRA